MENLTKIQRELKVPKGNFNSFGKYKYRSAEDILEAVKPVLANHNARNSHDGFAKSFVIRYLLQRRNWERFYFCSGFKTRNL